MLLGPNGAGKTSIINALSNNINYDGHIKLYDVELNKYKQKDLAKMIAFLPQSISSTFNFSVEEIVAMGRYCYQKGAFSSLDDNDKNIIDWAIKSVGLTSFKDRPIFEMSGGEVQRVFIAQALAQEAKILVLDEPTNNLDIQYQKQILELIQSLIKEKRISVISAVHDLSTAKYWGNKALLLDSGRAKAFDSVDKVFSSKDFAKIYPKTVCDYMVNLLEAWQD